MTPVPIDGWTNKHHVLHLHKATLFSKEEPRSPPGHNTEEAQKHAEWAKPDAHTACDPTYTQCLGKADPWRPKEGWGFPGAGGGGGAGGWDEGRKRPTAELWWWGHNSEHWLKMIELYTLKRMLWYINYAFKELKKKQPTNQ